MCLIVTPRACTVWRCHWCYGKKKASHWIHYWKFPYTFCSQVGEAESAARRCLKSGDTRCALMIACWLPLLLDELAPCLTIKRRKVEGYPIRNMHSLEVIYSRARMGTSLSEGVEREVLCCSSWFSAPSKRLHCILMSAGCATYNRVLLTTSRSVRWYTLNTLLALWILSLIQKVLSSYPSINDAQASRGTKGGTVEIRAEHTESHVGIHTCLLPHEGEYVLILPLCWRAYQIFNVEQRCLDTGLLQRAGERALIQPDWKQTLPMLRGRHLTAEHVSERLHLS